MKELFKRISISLFLGANLCTILLLWLCVGLTYIPPDTMPRLSLLTLAFPVFLAVDLLFVVFWLLFHAKLAWMPIAGALSVAGYILDYCPLNFGSNDGESSDSSLTIISYNVGYMKNDEQRDEFIRFIETANADIVCLQELAPSYLKRKKEWLDNTPYSFLQISTIVILSRHPFLSDTLHIDYPTRKNISLACWIDYRGDSLLVVNNHLESNMLSTEEKDNYANAITEPDRESIKSSSRVLLNKLSKAIAFRGEQADSVRAFTERQAGHPTIVCGDFNDTPISYTYQRLARRFNSAYRQKGLGPGFTYTRRSFPVRIDHFFYSNEWTCTSCRIERTILSSDHYPLIVRLSKKTR